MDYFLGKTGITRLASDLKTKFTALFAAISHTHNAATDLIGQVPIANGGTGAATQADAQTALDIAPKDGSAHTVGEIDTNLLGVVSKTGVDAMAVGEDDLRTQIQALQDSVSRKTVDGYSFANTNTITVSYYSFFRIGRLIVGMLNLQDSNPSSGKEIVRNLPKPAYRWFLSSSDGRYDIDSDGTLRWVGTGTREWQNLAFVYPLDALVV